MERTGNHAHFRNPPLISDVILINKNETVQNLFKFTKNYSGQTRLVVAGIFFQYYLGIGKKDVGVGRENNSYLFFPWFNLWFYEWYK